MMNKYLEKIAGIAGIIGAAKNVAKTVPGVLKDATGAEFKGLSTTQSRTASLADRATAKANVFKSLADNRGGDASRRVYGASARPLNQDIASHNANRASKLQAHANSLQPAIDQAELKTTKARNKVGLALGGAALTGAVVKGVSSSNNSQSYY
jgi:hypothetical protein